MVVVGNLANTTTLGDYSGDPSLQVSPVTGITQAIKAANPSANIYYDSCGTSTTATAPASCSAQTLSEIQNADLVVVFVGTDLNVATEGHDRGSIAMPGNYDSLISQVAGQGNPRMLLAIQSNGPVTISNVQKDFPAILFSGYNGESQGTALADVMFGKHNPSGHLDFTWFKNDSQLPPIEDYGLTPAQTGGLGRTYMYFTGKPTYPFGYGLSYSSFRYSGIHVSPTSTTPNGTVTVSFNVTNTGNVAGATVGQLYVTPPSDPALETPREQLAGFKRTNVLNPGQTQHITVSVKMSSLSRWDEPLLKQVVINGPYEFKVGADSAHLQASPQVTVAGTLSPHVQYVTVQPDQVIFRPGQTLDADGQEPMDQARHRSLARAAPRPGRQHRRGRRQQPVIRQPGSRQGELQHDEPSRGNSQPVGQAEGRIGGRDRGKCHRRRNHRLDANRGEAAVEGHGRGRESD